MKQYRFFEAFYMAFYSKNLYRDVAKNWHGYTILYLLLMVTLSWLVFAHRYHLVTNVMLDNLTQKIMTQMPPTITIKNGMVETPAKKPYVVKDEKPNDAIIVIDTTETHKTLPEAKNATILITRDTVILRDTQEERIYTIPKSFNRTYDLVKVNEFLKSMTPYLLIPFFIFLIIFSFVYRLLQAVIYAILGKLVAIFAGIKLSYGAIYQIMIVAFTPVITISAIIEFLYINVAHPYVLYFVIAMFYMIFGIYANKNPTK